jgi:hypothetical protein
LKKLFTEKGWWSGPEFKPQYHKKKKKNPHATEWPRKDKQDIVVLGVPDQ